MKTEYRGEVWQGGLMQASVRAATLKRVISETSHYALMYSQDGNVELKFFRKKPPTNRWRRMK